MNRFGHRVTVLTIVLTLLFLNSFAAAAQAPSDSGQKHGLTPIVLFPGLGGTRLEVEVHNQVVAPECPASGTFEFTLYGAPSAEFSQVCEDKLLTLRYDFGMSEPKQAPPWRISEQRGVRVRVADYGKTESAPLYEPLYAFLEQNGYQRNSNLRVAGYDFRLTPDMGGFLDRTKELVEETYRENRNSPVHLVAHSNGPLYAQYLLTHTSQQWKDKYIHGFTSIAGNFPGQGSSYIFLFAGLNASTGSYPTDPANAASSAAMWASYPATYMSAADPAYFGNQEVIIRVGPGGKEYTPGEAYQLFKDAGMELAQRIAPYYFGFVKFQPPFFPYVDTYAEKGSGLPTVVGVELPDLTAGQVLGADTAWILMDGDINQEDITNSAVGVWAAMRCYHFEFHDNPGIDHFSLATAPSPVWDRLVAHLQLPKSDCKLK